MLIEKIQKIFELHENENQHHIEIASNGLCYDIL